MVITTNRTYQRSLEFDFYSASSLKQQSTGRHVAPLGHIFLIPSQPVFALSPYWCVLSREATNTNFIVFCLTRPGLESMIYRTWDKHANHYATDAVKNLKYVNVYNNRYMNFPYCWNNVILTLESWIVIHFLLSIYLQHCQKIKTT